MPLWLRKLEQKMPENLAIFEIQVLMQMTKSVLKPASDPVADLRSPGTAGQAKYSPDPRGLDTDRQAKTSPDPRGRRPGRWPSKKSCLRTYQLYTKSCLENTSNEELPALRKAMYKKAFTVGRLLGKLPGITNDTAKTHLIKLLYRNIGIRIMGSLPGEIRIPRCSFSHFYTPQMCAVMSGMDAGIICGIFGGGTLTFNRRLTEGCPACMAVYRRN